MGFEKERRLKNPCPMRHENGNCLPSGGFCTSVNEPICEALHNAYASGVDDTIKDLADFVNKKKWSRRENNNGSI